MAEVISAGIGAAIGFVATGGNPMGALYGAQIGMSIGAYVFAEDQVIQGPKIGDVATQHSRENVPRPIIFGVGRPVGGNIIYSGEPVIKVVREKAGGGKGGGGDQYVEREEVYRTYAIRICEGPVTAIRRVWRNNELVFDGYHTANHFGEAEEWVELLNSSWFKNDPIGGDDVFREFLKIATFHLGWFDQMPDPALQAEFGVDNVTAHRGTCYMVIDNEDLTDLRGAIPQYIFEVERNEGFPLTSLPYPAEAADAVSLGLSVHTLQLQRVAATDAITSAHPQLTRIALVDEAEPEVREPEGVSVAMLTFNSLQTIEIPHTTVAPETLDYVGALPTAIALPVKRLDYELADAIDTGLVVTEITWENA